MQFCVLPPFPLFLIPSTFAEANYCPKSKAQFVQEGARLSCSVTYYTRCCFRKFLLPARSHSSMVDPLLQEGKMRYIDKGIATCLMIQKRQIFLRSPDHLYQESSYCYSQAHKLFIKYVNSSKQFLKIYYNIVKTTTILLEQ